VALVLFLALAAFPGGCSAQRPGATDDGWGFDQSWDAVTTSRKPVPHQRVIPPAARVPWALAADLSGLTPAGGRSPSEHFDGQLERTVLVNDKAARYRTLSSSEPFPQGALIVQQHHPKGGSDKPHSTFVARKKAPGFAPEQCDWELQVIDAESRVAATGRLKLCARCHQEAPHDCIFGPPTKP